VQEYSVITNNYSAEFGRASGGVVNVTTKAGTNKFHGGVWDFNRLSAATSNSYGNDAANWAAAQQDLPTSPKGTYTRNQYGFQVAGPVWKDKLFFEATTEWTKVRSAAVENEEIFDPAFIALLPANTKAYFGTYGTGAVPSSGVAATWGQLETTAFGNPQLNGIRRFPPRRRFLTRLHSMRRLMRAAAFRRTPTR